MVKMTKEELIEKLGIASVDPETQDAMLKNVGAAVSGHYQSDIP